MNIEQLYQLFTQHPHICTDTRKVAPNSLFFALKGDTFDGNLFAAKAIEVGCAYAIVDDKSLDGQKQCIWVDNVLETLQTLARYHRRQLGLPILAITGTNGKTTTKELIGSVLSQKFTIGITTGNLNNHIGVPLTLLSMDKHTNFGIVEMGANHLGEIAALCRIAEPNYGLITNIGKAHLEGFGSLEGVRKTKGELYDYLQANNGVAFVNTDDTTLLSMANEREGMQVQAYSASMCEAQVLPSSNQYPFLHFNIKNNVEIKTNLLGNYNLNNILAAIAIGKYTNISINKITDAIKAYEPHNNRSQLIRTANNALYMDAYNANPSSMDVAIRNFSELNENNKLLILGDMLELGNESLAEHRQIVEFVQQCGFAEVWFVGSNFIAAIENSKIGEGYHSFANVAEVGNFLKNNPLKNYTILIKGSRGIRLESLLEQL